MRRHKILLTIILTICLLVPINAQGMTKENGNTIDEQSKYVDSLEAIQNNIELSDNDKITQIMQNLFSSKAEDYVKNEKFDFRIYMDNTKGLSKSQKYFLDNITYLKKLKKRTSLVIDYYTINAKINNISINMDEAVVNLEEVFDYQIKGYENPSGTGVLYTIKLKKCDNKWLITDIRSDNTFEEAVLGRNIDMNECIKSADQPLSEVNITTESNIPPQNKDISVTSFTDTNYDREMAASYALQYSTSQRPTNPNFHTLSADCANFGSQSVWYGFGGVNSLTYINNKSFPMIDQGSSGARSWYMTQSGSTPTSWSWTSTNMFAKYMDAGGNVVGPYGFIYSGVAWAQKGDIIQVDWDSNQTPTDEFDTKPFDHTFVVTGVTGTLGSRTTSNITVSAHNNRVNNEPLSWHVDLSNNTLRTISIGGNLR